MVKLKKHLITLMLVFLFIFVLSGCSNDVESVSYKDGTYRVESDKFDDRGFRDYVEVEIKDSKIVRVDWNSVNKDNPEINKKDLSKTPEYNMKQAGAKRNWYEQAELAEKYVIDNQAHEIELSEDGHADAVAGVSIKLDNFNELLQEVLKKAEIKK